jgi:hypothetical protein
MYRTSQQFIIRLSDSAAIPIDLRNADYAKYLVWVSEGNTPDPEPQGPNPRIAEIENRLDVLDRKTVRVLRSKALGRDKPADLVKLAEWEDEADALRAELSGLS